MMRSLAASMLIVTAAPALCQTDDRDLAVRLNKQIMKCWSPSSAFEDAARPEQLIVQYEIRLNLDGSIAQLPQLSANPSVSAGDRVARAAADAALRAIWACAPYTMPPNRYEQWRDIVLTFDASHVLPQ